ncbi:hypothetical protein M378DRAFT_18144, partial [Amanita muscaria Koide BX008]
MEAIDVAGSTSRGPRTLADELATEAAKGNAKYWTYEVSTDLPAAENDLAQKWGLQNEIVDPGKRLTRAELKRQKEGLSTVQQEQKGKLSRQLADLNHHFNRNPEEVDDDDSPMNQLGEKLLGERCLSGKLVPEEGCLSGELVPDDRCLSGELAPGCLSGKLVPNTCLSSELAGNGEGSDGGRNTSEEDAVVGELFTDELESGLPTKAIVLRRANNNNRGEKIPGLCDGNISSPTWYDRCSEDDNDDGPGPLPPKWSRPFAKKNGPPVLPEIETSDGESLYEEINEKLSDWSRQEEMVTAQAVIVEVTPGPSKAPARNAQRSANSKSVKTRIPASEKKKGVSPEERGPLYEKLKAAARGGRKEAGARRQKTPAFFTQGPEHFRRDKSEKPDGGWFGKTTHGTESDSPDEATDSGGDDGNPPSSPSDSGFDD